MRLTARELEVLGLIAEGLSNEAIARRLAISVKTLESTCTSMFRTLGLVDGPDVNRRVLAAVTYTTHAAGLRHAGAIPQRTDRFIGRERELDDLVALLVRDRHITVVGPGGSGKTSLAMALATAEVDAGGRARIVELATARGHETAIRSVFESFGVSVADEAVGIRRVRAVIGDRPMLVVIDNAEHVTAAVAWIIERIEAMANVRIVVTSRTPLGSPSEHVWMIPPLRPTAAAQLVRDRSQVELTDHQVEQVCHAADGLPLVIELVVAQLATARVEEVIERLDQVHVVSGQIGPDRHRSIAAALETSYSSLGQAARTMFRALSVPIGGSDVIIARDCAGLPQDVGRALDGLVASSLVGATGTRYRMLEPVRQYAAELLDRAGERDAVETRFVVSIAAFVARGTHGRHRDPAHWSRTLDGERLNIPHAIDLALGRGLHDDALRIVVRLGEHWASTQTTLGYVQSRRVIDSCTGGEQPRLVGAALASTANLGSLLEPTGDWAPMFERAVDLLRRCDDRRGLGLALYWYARFSADIDVLDRAIEAAEAEANPMLLAWSSMNKATLLVERGQPLEPSLVLLRRAQAVARDANLPVVLAAALMRTVSCRLIGLTPGCAVVVDDEVRGDADDAEALLRRDGTDWQLYEVMALQARIRLLTADADAARPYVREAIERAVSCRSGSLLGEAVTLAATTLAGCGRPADAAALDELTLTIPGRPTHGRSAAVPTGWNPRWHPFFQVQLHVDDDDTADERVHLERLQHVQAAALGLLGPDHPQTPGSGRTTGSG